MALLLIARKWCKFQTEARQAVAFKAQEEKEEEEEGQDGNTGARVGVI